MNLKKYYKIFIVISIIFFFNFLFTPKTLFSNELKDTISQVEETIDTYIGKVNSIKEFILLKNKKLNESEAEKIANFLVKYSTEFKIEPELAASLIFKESRFNPNAVSPNGALGLGQLMPHTCKAMKLQNCFEIEGNIKGTVRYVRYLLDIWEGYEKQVEMALASYLLGPNAVKLYKNIISTKRVRNFIDGVISTSENIKGNGQ